jgi:hypothetical protein
MASMTSTGLAGAVGNLIFYQRDGKTYARTKPGPRKKKKGYKPPKEVTAFSMVSKRGTPMLQWLKQQISLPIGLGAYNAFRGWMMERFAAHTNEAAWPISIDDTPMLQLNPAMDIRNRLLFMPTCIIVDNGLQFSFPAFVPKQKIVSPAKTDTVCINIMVCSNTFHEKSSNAVLGNSAAYILAYTNELQPSIQLDIPITASKGDMVIVAISIDYFMGNGTNAKQIADAKQQPVAVVAMGRW